MDKFQMIPTLLIPLLLVGYEVIKFILMILAVYYLAKIAKK